MYNRSSIRRWMRSAAVISVLLLPISVSIAASGAEEKFVFALPNAVNVTVAPLNLAEELGYFKAENLTIEMPVLIGAGVIIPQLMNGSIQSTFIALEPLAIAKQPGAPNFAYKYGYNYLRNSVWELAVLDSSPIKTVADLAGKTIGVGGIAWGNVAGTKGILKASGVDPASVSLAAVGDGTPALEALRKGQIDALNLYDTKIIQFEQTGLKIRRLTLPPQYAGISSHGMPFTDRLIAERPDLIERFGRAVTKGLVACDANIEGCVAAFWKRNPSLVPASDQKADVLAKQIVLLRARLDNMVAFRSDEAKLYGAFTEKDWRPLLTSLHDAGLIQNTDIPLDTLYTNKFVAAFNDFDKAQIVQQAKAYRP